MRLSTRKYKAIHDGTYQVGIAYARVTGVYPIRLDSGGGNANFILVLHDGSYPVACTSVSKQKIILL
jgi:hypothetical protein